MYEISILTIDTSTMEGPLFEYYKSLKTNYLKKNGDLGVFEFLKIYCMMLFL